MGQHDWGEDELEAWLSVVRVDPSIFELRPDYRDIDLDHEDTNNATSVLQRIPIGVEDLATYAGAARLVRAEGTEQFDTTNDGQASVEHPEPGEPIWRDDIGVACRRWNWRQTNRTAVTDATTNTLFIVALGLGARQRATTALDTLRDALAHDTPSATTLIDASTESPRSPARSGAGPR